MAKRDYVKSSGNLFVDLGFPNADEMLAKAELAIKIADILRQRRLTQVQAERLLGVDQPKVSAFIRGRLSEFSIERRRSPRSSATIFLTLRGLFSLRFASSVPCGCSPKHRVSQSRGVHPRSSGDFPFPSDSESRLLLGYWRDVRARGKTIPSGLRRAFPPRLR